MIEVTNLTKRYGSKYAVNKADFKIESGEIVGLLGPNGAGKTTTMNMITGYISSTEGTVTVDGYDILKNPAEVKKRIGYLPEQPPLYMDMVVMDYLEYVYDLKKIKTDNKKEHIENILKLIKISDVKDRIIGHLSKGYRQRVGIAQALLGDPQILIFDEPTVGLDPQQVIDIRNMIKDLGKNRTVIISSHILSEISAICERVIIISKGMIVEDNSLENISETLSNTNVLQVKIKAEAELAEDIIKSIDKIKSYDLTSDGQYVSLDITTDGSDIREELFYKLADNKMPIYNMVIKKNSLEDMFLKITKPGDSRKIDIEEGGNNDESSVQ